MIERGHLSRNLMGSRLQKAHKPWALGAAMQDTAETCPVHEKRDNTGLARGNGLGRADHLRANVDPRIPHLHFCSILLGFFEGLQSTSC